MPLPKTFRSATLTVNGVAYDLVNVNVLDHEVSHERDAVIGAGRVRGFTAGRTTERVSFEAEVVPADEAQPRLRTVSGPPTIARTVVLNADSFGNSSQLEEIRTEAKKPSQPPKSRWERLMADESLV